VAHKTWALATRDLERVVVDTTVQPKAIAHPTDARYAIVRRRGWSILPDAMACRRGSAIGGGQASDDHGRPVRPGPSVEAGAA
jgi:hypothetical protein